MPAPFYITTAIDYTNAPPHIGHAYEKILADVLARYHRIKGDNVFFLTGVDQHGQKVQQAAGKEGIEPQEFVDRLSAKFTGLWEKLHIQYDGWAATTQPLHNRCVQQILQALFDAGKIYKAKYTGFYSVRQEQFLTDKERGEDGKFGPEWGEVVELEEENWYFRLTEYKSWLVEFIRNTPGLIAPEYRQRELLNAAERMEGDLSISRPKSRLSWGIEVPFDPQCVTFVWFDALVNYISFAGFDPSAGLDAAIANPQFRWSQLHVIGKDILIPAHGIYWLCMLKAMGFADSQMPRFLVHGYVLVDNEKMSKSIGNIKDPHTYADQFGVEALRYYLMRDCGLGADMDFTDDRLLARYNADLAKNLGNLLSRILKMVHSYRGGVLKGAPAREMLNVVKGEGPDAVTQATVDDVEKAIAAYVEAMDSLRINDGLAAAFDIATIMNGLLEKTQPWKLPPDSELLDAVLYGVAEALRIIAILIAPALPKSAEGIFAQLGWNGPMDLAAAKWGGLPNGHKLGESTPLFPRLDVKAKA